MGVTLQISVDFDDPTTERELLDDLTPAINYWMFRAGSHYGEALEQFAGPLFEDVFAASREAAQSLLPAYRAAEILTTKYTIEGDPVLMLMSYAVPAGTVEGKATCYIGPAQKVRAKAEVLARTYTILEDKIEE
jgi:hypothetical protein